MIIGVVKEIKDNENRVAIIPSFVESLTRGRHIVFVESGAGAGSGFLDEEYMRSGAEIVSSAVDVFYHSEMVVKVKEPQPSEYGLLKDGQVVFTYFHLASDAEQTKALLKSGATCVAYETITDDNGRLPLLSPMSSIAGRMSVLEGAKVLQKHNGGSGILISGVPGVLPANVVIIGGGCVGTNAAYVASGLGSNVFVADRSVSVLSRVDGMFQGRVKTFFANRRNITDLLKIADIVVGAVLVVGDSAPKVISRDMLSVMKHGSVIVDVSIDQGGCCESSRPTKHSDPVYDVDGIMHYCVTNMPGAFPRTSTIALCSATYPYIEKIANIGSIEALKSDHNLRNGLNVYAGHITFEAVAKAQNSEYVDPVTLL